VVNSVAVAVVTTVLGVFICALGGYGFAKYDFPGKGLLFTILLSSMMVPLVVLLIPLFELITNLGWVNRYEALVVPWLGPAFGVFMMRQFITQAIPDEMLDAGRIDGAGEFTLFWRLVLPTSRPALAALAVWLFLNVYNSFLWPLVVMSQNDRYTLPVGLNSILSTQGISQTDYGVVMAGALLAAAPTVLLFVMLRKQFIEGLTLGSVKG
jgi:ABC-type glycerol-3-phosphate transport system permease component